MSASPVAAGRWQGKVSMGVQIAVFAIALVVMVAGSYLHMRKQTSDIDEPDAAPDFPTILNATRAANPGLSFEPASVRSPEFFWVKELSTGREARVPNEELEGAKIRLVDCDLGGIAPALLYPNRTAISCLELSNARHVLQAYDFRTGDALAAQIAFFELNVTPQYRIGLGSGRHLAIVKRNWRRELTHEFIVSFMLGSEGGFVGYREDKPSGPH
jgi:hypothetical protein